MGNPHSRTPGLGPPRFALVCAPIPRGSPVSTVSWTFVLPSAASFVSGVENVQVAANGRPRQPSSIVSLNPATEFSESCTLVWFFVTTLIEPGSTDNVNCVAGPACTPFGPYVDTAYT